MRRREGGRGEEREREGEEERETLADTGHPELHSSPGGTKY